LASALGSVDSAADRSTLFADFFAVGSEEAHFADFCASLRPPLKPDMQFSHIRLS
jgi:hypothetical protein